MDVYPFGSGNRDGIVVTEFIVAVSYVAIHEPGDKHEYGGDRKRAPRRAAGRGCPHWTLGLARDRGGAGAGSTGRVKVGRIFPWREGVGLARAGCDDACECAGAEDAAFGRGIDRAVDALRKGGAEGVQTFRDELLTLRKGERALGRGGIDYDATLQQALSNRFSAMPEDSLRKIMITLQSDTLSAVRNELIDGPPREVQAMADALADAGLMSPLSSDALARPDVLRDLSLFESLALDESARRIDARGAENIDAALEHALGAVGQEAGE